MLKVGLTGGIGCGKTTVANVFAELGAPVLDADQLARALTETGRPALALIRAEFGADVLRVDGSLDRARLKHIIFADAERKLKLEAILHPLVYTALQAEIARLRAPYCIVSIPLLFETRMEGFVDRILVVDCPVELQIERVRRRDELDEPFIRSIIASQATRDYRRAHADDLLDNTQIGGALAEHVKKLHNSYISLSSCRHSSYCDQQNHL